MMPSKWARSVFPKLPQLQNLACFPEHKLNTIPSPVRTSTPAALSGATLRFLDSGHMVASSLRGRRPTPSRPDHSPAAPARSIQTTDSTAPDRAANAATTAGCCAPPATCIDRAVGVRRRRSRMYGAWFLTEDEVGHGCMPRAEEMGCSRLTGTCKSTGSGNLRWLRAKLTGGQVL